MANRFLANGQLKDEKIVTTLKLAARDYQNGEIAEVRDTLLEIVAAVDEWEDSA